MTLSCVKVSARIHFRPIHHMSKLQCLLLLLMSSMGAPALSGKLLEHDVMLAILQASKKILKIVGGVLCGGVESLHDGGRGVTSMDVRGDSVEEQSDACPNGDSRTLAKGTCWVMEFGGKNS